MIPTVNSQRIGMMVVISVDVKLQNWILGVDRSATPLVDPIGTSMVQLVGGKSLQKENQEIILGSNSIELT